MRLLAALSSACSARLSPGSRPVSISTWGRQPQIVWVADTEVGSDLGYEATCRHKVEHLAAELFGMTLGHGHRSFDG
jgi:hypothetical protein